MVAAVGGHAAWLPWRTTKMFARVTVGGVRALLNVIDTVRPLMLRGRDRWRGGVGQGECDGPAGDQALAVFRFDRLAGRALNREGVGSVGRGRAGRPGEAERERDDRGVRRIVDSNRRAQDTVTPKAHR